MINCCHGMRHKRNIFTCELFKTGVSILFSLIYVVLALESIRNKNNVHVLGGYHPFKLYIKVLNSKARYFYNQNEFKENVHLFVCIIDIAGFHLSS